MLLTQRDLQSSPGTEVVILGVHVRDVSRGVLDIWIDGTRNAVAKSADLETLSTKAHKS